MAGDDYKLIVAGNIDRDGQIVEAWDGDEQIAELFCSYRNDKVTFWSAQEVPLRLVEEMIAMASDRQPRANTYRFLLRKVSE